MMYHPDYYHHENDGTERRKVGGSQKINQYKISWKLTVQKKGENVLVSKIMAKINIIPYINYATHQNCSGASPSS